LKSVTPVIGVPDEQILASQAPGSTDQHLVESKLAPDGAVCTNICNCINGNQLVASVRKGMQP
jgi:hypothetical protein